MDVEDVKYVINFDYPQSSEDYIHRIGRTGRNEQTGTAYAFFTPENVRHANDLISVLSEANQDINPKLTEMAVGYKTGSMLPTAFGKKNKSYGGTDSRFNKGKYRPNFGISNNYSSNLVRGSEDNNGWNTDNIGKFNRSYNNNNRDQLQYDNGRSRYNRNFNNYKSQNSYPTNSGYSPPQLNTNTRYQTQQANNFPSLFNFSQPPPPPPPHPPPTTFSQQTPLSIY